MPPDLPIEQELTLKKRARRRLVGAIALVLLMVIILPQVLQDRAILAQQEPIKITMPELESSPVELAVNNTELTNAANQQPELEEIGSDEQTAEFKELIAEPVAVKKAEIKPVKESENKVALITPEASKIPTSTKAPESFAVQVGVYSDADNVKRLQEQLKLAGFSTYTEKVKTPKGDSLRLKAGNFNSRENAVAALDKIKAIGLSGIVIGNE
jgi:DedD protein